jgi:hypothetical protein
MVSLGFFNVSGQNDLPYVSSDHDTSNTVQSSLLSYSASMEPSSAGVRGASVWNLDLCNSCMQTEVYPSAALYNKPVLQMHSRRLASSVGSGLSTASHIQGWLSGPDGGSSLGTSCATACAPVSQTTNYYAGGFDRPYAPHEGEN